MRRYTRVLAGALSFCILCVGAAPAAADDRIIFVDDYVMDATVIGYNKEKDNLTLKVTCGTITIPRKRVDSVEYDTAISRSLAAEVEDVLALAGLMESHEGFEAAIGVLESLRSRSDAPDNIALKLAALYEKIGNYTKALENARAYLNTHPDDGNAQAEVDRLMREMKSQETTDEAPVIDVVEKKVDEGLEDGGWRVEPWGNPAEVFYVALGEGDRLLKVEMLKGAKDKLALKKALLAEQSDLTKNPTFMFDAYNNTTAPLNIALAVVTSPKWEFYESKQITLPSRKWQQRLAIDLGGAEFKCKQTDWQHTSTIKELDRVVNILFLVYQNDKAGTLFFNNVKVGE